jgi:hypothetical protein
VTGRGWTWLALALPAMAACAQIIHADFDGLQPLDTAGGSSGDTSGAGGSTPGGSGGLAGDGLGGSSGISAGGTGGMAMRDASSSESSTGGAAGSMAIETDVIVVDHAGDDVTEDANPDTALDAPTQEEAEASPPPPVVINEIEGVGEDWIELYNKGPDPFVLDGYIVTQASGSFGPPDIPAMLTFPAGTTLNAGAYLMILCKQATQGGPTNSCAGLAPTCFNVIWGVSSSSGEGIYFLSPERAILQEVDYPAPSATSPVAGQTWAAVPNGSGTFKAASPTPNASN